MILSSFVFTLLFVPPSPPVYLTRAAAPTLPPFPFRPASASLAYLHAGDQHAWHRSAGTFPCAFVQVGSEPDVSNLEMTSTWPLIAAQCSGVLSPASTALGSAPEERRAETAGRWPLWAARIRGVSSI